ncbi:hypothetical protein [Marivita hallyeonensis]|uniref:Phasin protein n=1 Tax=Marivita hallyeonensis TaxID=996342 RepID=A0A1M5QU48_9RHOB|nr:hypothetical protein [Marivita hallyeonensis]SHH17664.1 hypothetical protein SAMN05443551_1497 [Marivita hallyeonensis]
MPKATSKTTAAPDMSKSVNAMQAMSFLAPLIAPQIKQFWDTQEKVLDETQRFTQHWFERRHAAVRSSLDTARSVTTGGISNPMTAISMLTDWQRHSAERMAEDAREWFETMSRCAEYAVNTEKNTLDETMTEAADLARKVTKSAKSEPV